MRRWEWRGELWTRNGTVKICGLIFSSSLFFFFCMTENSEASTKLPSQESAVAKMQGLFLRLGRNPASQKVPGIIYNLTR